MQNIKDLLLLGPLAKEVLESADSSRRHHMPIHRRGAHRTLITVIEEVYQNHENEGDGEANLSGFCGKLNHKFGLRLPKNCSGAIYGSLPHSPVDMCTVVSQGSRYTVDAP